MVVFFADAFSFSSDPLDLDQPAFSTGGGPDDCLSRREVVSGRSNTPDSVSLDDSGLRRVVIEADGMVDVVGGTFDCPSERSRRLDVDASKLAFLSFNCSIFFLRINEL
jgi:hypothetical protein